MGKDNFRELLNIVVEDPEYFKKEGWFEFKPNTGTKVYDEGWTVQKDGKYVIDVWCEENLEEDFVHLPLASYFKSEKDRFDFIIQWGT